MYIKLTPVDCSTDADYKEFLEFVEKVERLGYARLLLSYVGGAVLIRPLNDSEKKLQELYKEEVA